ncbi:MAG TPA: 4-hydroxy-tetrahydrodipicolinate reductase [bacterium]|nr:4-hydroxy-tetrahydrodipicolinate reductase [bacterium]HPN29528.1 4-hydroxy-tetrahydrodipicolinate reductase [bacterium]
MIKIGVVGATGRMGRMIINSILQNEKTELAAGLERKDHPLIGKNICDIIGTGEINSKIKLTDNINEFINDSEVIIDFSSIESTLNLLKNIKLKSKKVVIGTTGFSEKEKKIITGFSKNNACVFSPNMSMGVNLLFKLASVTAAAIGKMYDIEIIESHHNKKKDSPSGTAVKIAEVICEAVDRDIEKCGVYGRKGITGERTKKEIGIHAVRAGDIVGEHTVIFAGYGERIELTHKAHTRETFANGAVNAAVWVNTKKSGLYSMQDALGIKPG